MDNKVRVIFYKAEVKYTGSLEDYSTDMLLTMAKLKASKGVEVFDHYEDIDEDEVINLKLDGKVEILSRNWGKQTVGIRWSYIEVKKKVNLFKDYKRNDTLGLLKLANDNLKDNIKSNLRPEDMTNVNLGIMNTLLGDIALSLAMIADNTNKEEA